MKKMIEKVYAIQVGSKICHGPYLSKDCQMKEEGKTVEEVYYGEFNGRPYRTREENSQIHEAFEGLVEKQVEAQGGIKSDERAMFDCAKEHIAIKGERPREFYFTLINWPYFF
nr:hypothetical protein [Tanacetum cinerariifolium]